MNILIFQQAPDVGGSETYMAALVKQWRKLGDTITIYTNYQDYKQLLKKSNAVVKHLPFILDIIGNKRGFVKTCLLLPFATVWYFNALKSERSQTDVIILSAYTEKLLVTFLADLLKIPVIWFEYPPMEKLLSKNFKLPKLLYRFLSRKCLKVITISQNTEKSLIADTKISPHLVQLIYPGVEVPGKARLMISHLQAKRLKKELGLEGKFIIGSISRLAPEKGQEYLIKALPFIKEKIKNIALLIAGRGPDLQRLKSLTVSYGLEKDVYFLGFVKNKYAVLSLIDVFIFTGTWKLEGFGLARVEAMAVQKPVISFDFPPVREIIINNRNGLLVKPRSGRELSLAVIRLYQDTKLSSSLGVQARKDIIQRFNIIKTSKQIKNLISSLLKENRL